MQLINALLAEVIGALDERHYVTAGMLAGAAYVMGLRKSNNGTLIARLGELDRKCQYGNFYDAAVMAREIRAELDAIL